ncbi:MucR family transcriptional regulator [soil metagenome]
MDGKTDVLSLTAQIVSAYASNNPVGQGELPKLISDVYRSLISAGGSEEVENPELNLKPAVSIRRSVGPDYLICLEDGKKFKSLKRHLRTHYDLSPEQYREKWSLPPDYPMVSANYAKARSSLAKKIGLGQSRSRG